METLSVSVPFFTLLGMPDCCKLFDSNRFILRDILQINPNKKGDYENGPYLEGLNVDGSLDYVFYFEEMQRLVEKKHYDRIDILFRGIHKDFDGSARHLIVGYYEVFEADVREIAPGVYMLSANKGHFVERSVMVDVTEKIIGYNLQDSILKSNSVNHPEYKEWIEEWMNLVLSEENIIGEYIEVSKNLRSLRASGNYANYCEGCQYYRDKVCPLWGRILAKEGLV